jgi:hypothetical protein
MDGGLPFKVGEQALNGNQKSAFGNAFFAMSPVRVELTKKQPIGTKAVESLKGIGRRLARFPLEVDQKRNGQKTERRGSVEFDREESAGLFQL